MLNGDLRTMSLADVLQWADATRVRGRLVLERRTGPQWIYVDDRCVRATALPKTRSVPIDELNPAVAQVSGLPLPIGTLAIEALYDQFLDSDDPFRFDPAEAPPGDGAFIDIPLQEIVMEGMRHLDEWPDIRELYKSDQARLSRLAGEHPSQPSLLGATLLQLAEQNVTLSEARLCLGVSRPALLRHTEALRRLGCIAVDGAPAGGNLIDKLIEQASVLLRAQQFDEAAHVFGALLSADPGARRIKRLLRDAERDHVDHLYRRMPANASVRVTDRMREVDKRLTRSDREVIDHINGRWDVATLVMASRLREVETLKSLERLLRMEAVELRLPGPAK